MKPVMHKLPRPRLRARKLSSAGKSSYSGSGGKGAAFHPSGGNPALGGGGMGGALGGVPAAGPAAGGDQPGAFAPMPPDQAFAGPNGGQ